MTKPSGIQTRSAQRLGKAAHASTSSKLTPIGITTSIPNHGNQNEYANRHLPSPRLNSPKSEPAIAEDCKYKTRYHYQQSHHLKPSLANSHLKQLHTRGYIVLKNKVRWQPKDIQQFINEINGSNTTRPIFNNVGRNDGLRQSCGTSGENKMSDALKILFPNKIQSDYFILKSVGGCKPQRLHCDYAPTDSIMKCEDQEVPLVCLTSISDACSVLVCENSIRYTSTVGNVKQVWLKRGDLMVFRGDLVHAGSGYTSDNYRMHCYLDSIKVKREPNKTWKL